MAESGTIYEALIAVNVQDNDAPGQLAAIIQRLEAQMARLGDMPGVNLGEKITGTLGQGVTTAEAGIAKISQMVAGLRESMASLDQINAGGAGSTGSNQAAAQLRATTVAAEQLIVTLRELSAVQSQPRRADGMLGLPLTEAQRFNRLSPEAQAQQMTLEEQARAASRANPIGAAARTSAATESGLLDPNPDAREVERRQAIVDLAEQRRQDEARANEMAQRSEARVRKAQEAVATAAEQRAANAQKVLAMDISDAQKVKGLTDFNLLSQEEAVAAVRQQREDAKAPKVGPDVAGYEDRVAAQQRADADRLKQLASNLSAAKQNVQILEDPEQNKRFPSVDAGNVAYDRARGAQDRAQEAYNKELDRQAAAANNAATAEEAKAKAIAVDLSLIDETASARKQELQLAVANAEQQFKTLQAATAGSSTEAQIAAARIKVLRAQEALATQTERESKAAAGSGAGGMGFLGGFMGGHGGSGGGGSDLLAQAGFAAKYYAFYKVFELGSKLIETVKTQTEEYSLAVNQLSIAMGTNYEQASKFADSYATIGQSLATAPSVAINAATQYSRFFKDQSGDSGTIGAQLGSTIQLLEGRSAKDGEEQQLVEQRMADLAAIAQNYDLGASGASNLYDASTLIAQHYGRQYGGDLLGGTAQIADLLKESGFSPEQGLALVGSVQQYTGTSSELAAGDLKRFLGRSGQNSFQDIFSQYQVNTNQSLHGELGDLGEVFKTLNPEQSNQVISKLGGGRAGAAVVAAIKDIADQNAAAQKGAEGVGAALDQGYKKLDTFAGKMEQISTDWKTLAKDLGESDLAKPFGLALSAIDPMLRAIDSLVNAFDRLPVVLQAATAALVLWRTAGKDGIISGLNTVANLGKGGKDGKDEAKDSALTSSTDRETQAQTALTEATTTATAALEEQAAAAVRQAEASAYAYELSQGATEARFAASATGEITDLRAPTRFAVDSAGVATDMRSPEFPATTAPAASTASTEAATANTAAQERLAAAQATAAAAATELAVAEERLAAAQTAAAGANMTDSAKTATTQQLALAEAETTAATAAKAEADALLAVSVTAAEATAALEAETVAQGTLAVAAAETAGASRLAALRTGVTDLGTAAKGALANIGPLLLLLAGTVAFGAADKQGKGDAANRDAANKAMDDYNNATTPAAKAKAAAEVAAAQKAVKASVSDSKWYGDLLLQGQSVWTGEYSHSWDDSPAKQRGVLNNQLNSTLDEQAAYEAQQKAGDKAAASKKDDGTLTAQDVFGPDYTSIDRGMQRLNTLRLSATSSVKFLTELLKNVPDSELPDLLTPGTGAKGLPDELKRLTTNVGRETDPVAKQRDLAAIQQLTALASQRAAASGSDQQDSAAQAADDATKALDAVVLKNLQMRVAKLGAEGGGKSGSRAQITALMEQAALTFGKNGDIDSMIALLNSADASFLGAVKANFRAQAQILKDQIRALEEAVKAGTILPADQLPVTHGEGPLALGESAIIQDKRIAAKKKQIKDYEKALDGIGKAEPYSTPSGSATKPLDDAELARIQSTETPGDAISQARVNLQVAQYQLGKAQQGTKDYWTAIKALNDAQFALSQAELAGANAAIMAGATSGDPVSQANAALAVAQANLAAAVGSTEKAVAQKAVNDAAYQKLQSDTAAQVAQIQGAAIIADPVSQATAALAAAKVQLDAAVGSTAYWTQLKAYRQAQYDLAQAERDAANTADLLGIDITDPVAQAREKVRAATRQLNADRKRGAGKDVINTDLLNVRETTSAAEKAQFDQKFSDEQTNYNLNRISLSSYMSYLQSQHDYLTAVKHKTRDQVDELNQVDQALKSLTDSMDGQFNLGNIKVPTPYEVRRSMAGGNPTGSTQNVTITINGSDLNAVRGVMGEYLGQGVMQTTGTTTRKV